ncbi:MAG: long-chain fatty acid--CoA ligase [Acidimicrobiia bacterium]
MPIVKNRGLGSWPQRRARMTPHRIALTDGEQTITYQTLADRSAALANAFRGLGIRAGDRVAYLGPNHSTYFDVLFGATALGAIMVPINTRLAAPEVRYVLSDSGADVIVAAPTHEGVLGNALAGSEGHRVISTGLELDEMIESAHRTWVDDEVALDDVAIIMYTSGTTGRPKGAMLTHGNLTWNIANVLIDLDLRHDELALIVAPLFHIAALAMISLPILVKGGTLLLQPGFEPTAALELIENYGVTQMFGVPTMFNLMAKTETWADADISSLRAVMCGGAPVPKATIETYLERGIVFLQGYGMTETAPGLLFLDGPSSTTKAGSAGVPSFFTDVRLVDPTMQDVAAGERGEVLAAGPNVMKGYWQRPGETSRSFNDGWFHTGDVATRDDDGYYTIVDRVKDIIISGGENIYPAEIEDALLFHPAVAEAAVIGVPNDQWGEVGRAIVVLREKVTEEELMAFLEERLARYKLPKSIVFTDDLPKSGAGKILKRSLRERYP